MLPGQSDNNCEGVAQQTFEAGNMTVGFTVDTVVEEFSATDIESSLEVASGTEGEASKESQGKFYCVKFSNIRQIGNLTLFLCITIFDAMAFMMS